MDGLLSLAGLARETHRQEKQQLKVGWRWDERSRHYSLNYPGLATDLEEEPLVQLQPRYVNTLFPVSSSLLLHDNRYDVLLMKVYTPAISRKMRQVQREWQKYDEEDEGWLKGGGKVRLLVVYIVGIEVFTQLTKVSTITSSQNYMHT